MTLASLTLRLDSFVVRVYMAVTGPINGSTVRGPGMCLLSVSPPIVQSL